MPYPATSETDAYDPRAITVMPPLTMWAQWVLHVVYCLVCLGLECLGLPGKPLYLLTLDSAHYHSQVSPPLLLLGLSTICGFVS